MNPFFDGAGKVRYSSIRANNPKWLLLEQTDGHIHLYTIQGEPVQVLPRTLRTDTEVVFSWEDPDLVYHTLGNKVVSYNLVTGVQTLIAEFTQFVELTAYGAESDLTHSGLLALAGVNDQSVTWLFVLNVLTGKVMGEYRHQYKPFDGRKVTEKGTLLVSDVSGIKAIYHTGLERMVTEANGHAAPAQYKGEDVLLWCANDRVRGWANTLEIIPIDYPSQARVLFDCGRDHYAMQLSAGPNEVFMCLYDSDMVLPSQLWQVPYDGSTPTKWHEWSAKYRDYDSSPKCSYSDGYVFYNEDNGTAVRVRGLKLEGSVSQPKLTRIDYSSYAGKSRFIMVPRADGAVDIFEEKL